MTLAEGATSMNVTAQRLIRLAIMQIIISEND